MTFPSGQQPTDGGQKSGTFATSLIAPANPVSRLSNSISAIVGQGQMTCLGRGIENVWPFSCFTTMAVGFGSAVSCCSAINNVLLLADQTAPYYVTAVNLTTGAVTQDYINAMFDAIHEDASGCIWAISSTPGYSGLYKRTGPGAWTKLIYDAGTPTLRRWIDGSIYYNDSANNWYLCAGGSASLSSNPSANTLWLTYSPTGFNGNDNVAGGSGSNLQFKGFGIIPLAAGYCGTEMATVPPSARYWPISAAGQNSGTKIAPLGNVNWEHFCECTQPGRTSGSETTIDAQENVNHKFYRLDATYMLHTTTVREGGNPPSGLAPDAGSTKIVMTILNKLTGVNKHIGSLYLTASTVKNSSSTVPAVVQGGPVGASFSNGVLDVFIALNTYYKTGTATDDCAGLFKKSLTLNLDF